MNEELARSPTFLLFHLIFQRTSAPSAVELDLTAEDSEERGGLIEARMPSERMTPWKSSLLALRPELPTEPHSYIDKALTFLLC